MQNYFNYFTEIEEQFQRRRGSLLMLSTLDWALIETWREAGIPLEAALRGIDEAFDKHEARQHKGRARRINGLAWCAQAVMEAAEQQKEAATGMTAAPSDEREAGFEAQRIAAHFEAAAQALDAAAIAHASLHEHWTSSLSALALRLRAMPTEMPNPPNASTLPLEELERELAMLEEKLFATLTMHAPEEILLRLKTEAARELASYRSRMGAVQLRQIEQQFVHKRLLEHYKLPRLSLFYMSQDT